MLGIAACFQFSGHGCKGIRWSPMLTARSTHPWLLIILQAGSFPAFQMLLLCHLLSDIHWHLLAMIPRVFVQSIFMTIVIRIQRAWWILLDLSHTLNGLLMGRRGLSGILISCPISVVIFLLCVAPIHIEYRSTQGLALQGGFLEADGQRAAAASLSQEKLDALAVVTRSSDGSLATTRMLASFHTRHAICVLTWKVDGVPTWRLGEPPLMHVLEMSGLQFLFGRTDVASS
jgi:hypothetical protein